MSAGRFCGEVMTASQHMEEIKIAAACYANGQWSYISDQNKRAKN
jgi:hypothetical protein